MPEKKRLIIVSDYGLDDACALAFLLKHAGRFCGIDILCVAGNSPADASLKNAQKLLAAYGSAVGTDGMRLIDTASVSQNCARLPSVHGVDGMGDLFDVPARAVPYLLYDAWKRDLPADNAIVLSLGPCTVALDVIKRLNAPQTIIMAGVVGQKPNYNGMEFNQALDPGSFRALVKFPHRIATLDTCRVPAFNLSAARFGKNSIFCRLLNRMIALKNLRHPGNSYIYDLITALYLIEPEHFAVRKITDPWGNELSELRVKDEAFSLEEYLGSKE